MRRGHINTRTLLLWCAILLALAAFGAFFFTLSESSVARVEGVLVAVTEDARPIQAGETGRLKLIRSGREKQAVPDMALRHGDALVTGPDGFGVMTLAAGYRVIMEPNTDLSLENPSIFLRLGRVIVKKIGDVREAFRVKTELGAAAVEGTEFVLEINRQREVQVTVLEGQLTVYPAEGLAWHDTLTYVAGNRGRLDSARFEWLPPLPASAMDSLRRRIKNVESASDVKAVLKALAEHAREESQRVFRRYSVALNVPWTMTAGQHRDKNGQRFSFQCPPGGMQYSVWGTGVYTDDSSICTAAVHAGAISSAQGGTVTIEIIPGQDTYEGSTRHGVTTGAWGPWHGSFRIVESSRAP